MKSKKELINTMEAQRDKQRGILLVSLFRLLLFTLAFLTRTIMHLEPKQWDKDGDISMPVLRSSLEGHIAVPS